MKTTARNILKEARDLLSDYDAWAQGTFAQLTPRNLRLLDDRQARELIRSLGGEGVVQGYVPLSLHGLSASEQVNALVTELESCGSESLMDLFQGAPKALKFMRNQSAITACAVGAVRMQRLAFNGTIVGGYLTNDLEYQRAILALWVASYGGHQPPLDLFIDRDFYDDDEEEEVLNYPDITEFEERIFDFNDTSDMRGHERLLVAFDFAIGILSKKRGRDAIDVLVSQLSNPPGMVRAA